ncbi:MAG TPA: hypothetical protein DCG12_16115 [Planctomycetaceae bacterium]|nr:hypothetical protein [Planctomycetaceae bacterium]
MTRSVGNVNHRSLGEHGHAGEKPSRSFNGQPQEHVQRIRSRAAHLTVIIIIWMSEVCIAGDAKSSTTS